MLNVTFELERRKSLHYSLGGGGRDIPGKKDSRRKSTQTEKCPFKFKIACSSVWLVSVLYNGKSGESHLNGLLGSEHAKMTNAYGPHPTGNGETLNIFEQGSATTNRCWSSGNSSGSQPWGLRLRLRKDERQRKQWATTAASQSFWMKEGERLADERETFWL